MSQLSFGAPPDIGPGDACGRCFRVTGTGDPYNSAYPGPYKSIVVKITDLCPVAGNPLWCAQTTAKPTNTFNMSVQYVLALLPLLVSVGVLKRNSLVALTCAGTRVPAQRSSQGGAARLRARTRRYRAMSGPEQMGRRSGQTRAFLEKLLIIGPLLVAVILVRRSLYLRHEMC